MFVALGGDYFLFVFVILVWGIWFLFETESQAPYHTVLELTIDKLALSSWPSAQSAEVTGTAHRVQLWKAPLISTLVSIAQEQEFAVGSLEDRLNRQH